MLYSLRPVVCAPRRLCAPSFVLVNSLLVMASLVVSLFASPASAQTHGTFQTSYSGGSVTAKVLSGSGGSATCSNTPQITPFNPGGYPPYSGSANVSAGTDSGGGTNQCSAQIVNSPLTAAFAWTPDPRNPSEPAPTSGILTQTCDASWSFGKDSTSTASGTGPSNGLSNGVVTPPGSDPDNQSATSSSTLYSAWSGSSVSNSPSAGFSGTSGPGYSHAGLSGSVSATYSASVTPIFINLTGAVKDSSGNDNILVGQGCGATLSGIPTSCTVSNYQWSVSGTTFQDWQPTTQGNQSANPPVPANSQASYYDPGPGDQTQPTYHWFWNDPTKMTETVTCTATVTPPAGQGAAFQVTATQKVTVYVPTRSPNTNDIGDGRIINSTIKATPTPAMRNNLESFGSSWSTGVSLPTTSPAFAAGQWCYCQLITPGEYLTIGGKQYQTTETVKGDGLDASFPYVSSAQDTGLQSTDGTKYHEGDSPYLSGLTSSVSSVTLTDTLHTYVMFKPAGNNGSSDVRWVALSESRWDTNFNANIPDGGWSAFSPDESVGPINLIYTFVQENNPPMWTQIVSSGDVTLVPYN